MSRIGDQIAELVTVARAEGGGQAATSRIIAKVPDKIVRYMAAAYLADRVRSDVRRATLAAERAAMRTELMNELSSGGWTPSRSRPALQQEWETETPKGREYRTKLNEADRAIDERYYAKMHNIIEDYTKAMRIEWTAELLQSSFTLTDGSITTWGAATVEQHEERAGAFESRAAANIEGAARHKKAIEELRTKGATCLDAMLTAA